MSEQMTLEEKLSTINKPAIVDIPGVGRLPSGQEDTVEDFFWSFVKPRLPKEDVVKKWHKLLMEYVSDEKNLSCCVRYGSDGSDKASEHGESGYKKLRRGWLTKNTNDDFEYFFADNFFTSFIYKMALDGFVPASVAELRDVFRRHKFPYGFGFKIDKKYEADGVTVTVGPEPGFLDNYKISHIFDAGKSFYVDGRMQNDAELSKKYYDIGCRDDFLKNKDCIRQMDITPDAKKVIIAKFLRFAHPINYFLTPAKKYHVLDVKVYKNDIGEEPVMVERVKSYIEQTYPEEYKEFVERILWPEMPTAPNVVNVAATTKIGIHYGPDIEKNAKVGIQYSRCTENIAPREKSFFRVSKVRGGKYSEKQKLDLAEDYMFNGTVLVALEKKLNPELNGKGGVASHILTQYGLKENCKGTKYQGMFKNMSIDEAIASAVANGDDVALNVLKKIKDGKVIVPGVKGGAL